MERLLKIDALRGLLLLIMVANHTPSPARNLTTQPLGFVSAAEAFVFVAAFLCGIIFNHKLHKGGMLAVRVMARQRLRQIYKAHLLTLLFCFVVLGNLLGQQPAFYNMVHSYLERPLAAVFSSLFLLYQPPLLDILPMYLIFIALTPLLIRLAIQIGEGALLGMSAILWLAAQLGIKERLLEAVSGGWLVIDPGAFNLFAWQLLWIGGLLLGRRSQQQRPLFVLTLPQRLRLILIGIAVFFFCCRWPWIPIYLELGTHEWLLDKWHLGPLRILNFVALLFLAMWLGSALRRVPPWFKPFALLGQHLLPLFCLHVCFSLLATGIIENYALGDIWGYALLTVHLSAIFVASLFMEQRTNNLSISTVFKQHLLRKIRLGAIRQALVLAAALRSYRSTLHLPRSAAKSFAVWLIAASLRSRAPAWLGSRSCQLNTPKLADNLPLATLVYPNQGRDAGAAPLLPPPNLAPACVENVAQCAVASHDAAAVPRSV